MALIGLVSLLSSRGPPRIAPPAAASRWPTAKVAIFTSEPDRALQAFWISVGVARAFLGGSVHDMKRLQARPLLPILRIR